jgi:hypothetical protein
MMSSVSRIRFQGTISYWCGGMDLLGWNLSLHSGSNEMTQMRRLKSWPVKREKPVLLHFARVIPFNRYSNLSNLQRVTWCPRFTSTLSKSNKSVLSSPNPRYMPRRTIGWAWLSTIPLKLRLLLCNLASHCQLDMGYSSKNTKIHSSIMLAPIHLVLILNESSLKELPMVCF